MRDLYPVLQPNFTRQLDPGGTHSIYNEASIETHYAYHRYFIEEDQNLRDVHLLQDIPVIIIRGRRDITCTADASWQLHGAIPGSELHIVPNGGPLAGEGVIIDALVAAADRILDILI